MNFNLQNRSIWFMKNLFENFINKKITRSKAVHLLQKMNISEPLFLIFFAVVIGGLAGTASSAFQFLINFFSKISWIKLRIFFLEQNLPLPLFIVLVPTLGGLLVGFIVNKYAREVEGIGVPEVIESVALKGGIIRPRVIWAKVITAALFIGTGGSAGRVGPIVQIGAAIGSFFGKLFKLSGRRMKVLIACGAASGIAGIFNAPMAGILFSLEIILGDITIETFSPVVFSTITTSIIVRTIIGSSTFLAHLSGIAVSYSDFVWFIVLGIFSGVFGLLFIHSFHSTVDFFKKIPIPHFLKPAIGGLIIGFMALKLPQILGLGLDVINSAVNLKFTLLFFALLFIAKFLATSISIGSGGSGGIFSPAMFLGAMLGAVFVLVLKSVNLPFGSNPSTYVIIGMMAFLAGLIRAPLTATLLIYEITDNHMLILPVLIASLISSGLIYRLVRYSIYTMKLARRGVVLKSGREENVLASISVVEIMQKKFITIPLNAKIDKIFKIMVEHVGFVIFPVVDEQGNLFGTINLQDIREFIFDNEYKELGNLIVAMDLAQNNFVTVSENETLLQVFQKFNAQDDEQILVVSKRDSNKVVGYISKDIANLYYQKKLLKKLIF